MPVEQVPGFWDYLGQGVQKGIDLQRQNAQIAREEAHKKTAEAQAQAGLIGQLFQSGAVGSKDLQSALTATGLPAPTVIPSKSEQRQHYLDNPDQLATLSDEQKKNLGFTSKVQAATEGAQVAGANLETKRADLLNRYMSGENLGDQQAEAIGMLSASDRELKKVSQLDPYLSGVGERYIAGQMVKAGGRIDPNNAQQIGENAYTTYVAERAQNGLGTLTPEQVQYTRQYFARATENALIAQKKQDLAEYEAKTGRIHAEAAKSTAGQNTSMQWFGKVTTALDNVRKAQANITKANPAVLYALDNPSMAQSPIVKGALDQYNALEQTAAAFRGAQGSLASGQVPGNLADLLAAADSISSQGAGPAAGGARTAAPPTGRSAAPAGGPTGGRSPAGQGRAGQAAAPAAAAPPAADPVVTSAIQLLKTKKGNLTQLKEALDKKKITRAQYDAIIEGSR